MKFALFALFFTLIWAGVSHYTESNSGIYIGLGTIYAFLVTNDK